MKFAKNIVMICGLIYIYKGVSEFVKEFPDYYREYKNARQFHKEITQKFINDEKFAEIINENFPQ